MMRLGKVDYLTHTSHKPGWKFASERTPATYIGLACSSQAEVDNYALPDLLRLELSQSSAISYSPQQMECLRV